MSILVLDLALLALGLLTVLGLDDQRTAASITSTSLGSKPGNSALDQDLFFSSSVMEKSRTPSVAHGSNNIGQVPKNRSKIGANSSRMACGVSVPVLGSALRGTNPNMKHPLFLFPFCPLFN